MSAYPYRVLCVHRDDVGQPEIPTTAQQIRPAALLPIAVNRARRRELHHALIPRRHPQITRAILRKVLHRHVAYRRFEARHRSPPADAIQMLRRGAPQHAVAVFEQCIDLPLSPGWTGVENVEPPGLASLHFSTKPA